MMFNSVEILSVVESHHPRDSRRFEESRQLTNEVQTALIADWRVRGGADWHRPFRIVQCLQLRQNFRWGNGGNIVVCHCDLLERSLRPLPRRGIIGELRLA